MSTRVYVGNLSFDATGDDLQDLFSGAGAVREATVIQDRNTGKSRGFAFVIMSSDEEARSAITKFNGHAFRGRNLTVNEARPLERVGGPGQFAATSLWRRRRA
jgi:cold-inducible RNA-binding protein